MRPKFGVFSIFAFRADLRDNVRMLKTVLVLSFALNQIAWTGGSVAAKAPEIKSRSATEMAIRTYNLVGTAPRLILLLKAGAKEDDGPFLEQLAEKYKGERLPKATAKNGLLYLQGLDKPLKSVDAKKLIFSYNGKNLDFSMPGGYEKGLADIEKVVYPDADAVWNWIFPKAYAAIDARMTVAALVGLGGIYGASQTCFDGPSKSDGGCFFSTALGAGGAVFFLMSLLDSGNQPTGLGCYPGGLGCSQTVITSAGRPMTISQCPGQPYSFSPALAQVPPSQAQMLGSQVNSVCSYPGVLSGLNTALAQPPRIPIAQQLPPLVRPLGGPAIVPYSATAKPVPPATTRKPAAVRPALAPQTTPPAKPAGGAAK